MSAAKTTFRVLYDEVKTEFNMQYPHFHDEFEIYYLYEGQRNLFCDGRLYTILQGSLLYLDASKMHRVFSANPKPYRRIMICLGREFLQGIVPPLGNTARGLGIVRLNAEHRQIIEGVFKRIIDEIKKPDKMSEMYKELLIKELIILIARLDQTERDADFINNALMDRVFRYIDDNIDKRISLYEAAREFNYSVSHFSKLFREATGFTFVEYINESRVRRAQGLLKTTNLPISEVMRLTGFSSQAYFGKVFRNVTGESPLQYRRSNKKL